MKIAIQGHPTRGKEVIQILESLGGENKYVFSGTNFKVYYFITEKNIIDRAYCTNLTTSYKLYFLEEFEIEFPFKIGDEVIFPVKTGWASEKVTDLTYVGDQLKYEVDTRIGGYQYVEPHKLSLYPMKKERNITLTLEKAKEWYNKGGELREIALQAFTEKELNPLPRSWAEYCRKHKSVCLSTRHANIPLKYDALIKLEQLRNCWWNDWKPEWNNCEKYVIKWDNDDLIVFTARNIRAFLVFPTREMAYEFLKCFRDLIEKAGDLI